MMLQWLGAFAFGPSMLVYRGRAADNSPHAHASIPLSVAQTGTLSILDGQGQAGISRLALSMVEALRQAATLEDCLPVIVRRC